MVRKVLLVSLALPFILLFVEVSSAQESTEAKKFYEDGRKAYLKFSPEGFNKAVELYSKAAQSDPKFAPAYAGLAEVYSLMGHNEQRDKEYYEQFFNKSYENMLKALKLGKDMKETRRALALSYLHLNRKKEAEETARLALQKDPNDAEVHYILWSANGSNPSSPNIKKVFELNPDLAIAYADLGDAYFYKRRNYEKAEAYYRKAAGISDSARMYSLVGTALRTRGRLGEAAAEYRKAIERDPDFAPAHMNLGITLLYSGNAKKAISELEKAISLNPNYPDSYFFLAEAFERTNDRQRARLNYESFLKLAGGQDKYATYVSKAKENLGKPN